MINPNSKVLISSIKYIPLDITRDMLYIIFFIIHAGYTEMKESCNKYENDSYSLLSNRIEMCCDIFQ